ncbi:FAD:protein FMN transferase [Janibacter melonis]|uniref:FAD:protein FMN transferase n=3 Tax=Janibacter melonis TaxID=262209 RepID=A0A5P8FRB9_9MICO|nr:FAD:protein FMN transferase [Janibacter melonis]
MGMPVSVAVRGPVHLLDGAAPHVEQVYARLRRVDRVFSTYRDDSDLVRVRRGEIGLDEAHPWLAEVADLCARAEDVTDGLFSARAPAPGGGRVFDPTGLVKGWAVATASEQLRLVPGVQHLVDAGGDVVAGTGTGLAGPVPPWRVGIEDPADRTRVARVVEVARGAVATSGAAARGAHVYDPRSGTAISPAGSASVVGPDLLWADVWATAAYVDPVAVSALLPRRAPGYELVVLG